VNIGHIDIAGNFFHYGVTVSAAIQTPQRADILRIQQLEAWGAA
jgi:hypothetical protein